MPCSTASDQGDVTKQTRQHVQSNNMVGRRRVTRSPPCTSSQPLHFVNDLLVHRPFASSMDDTEKGYLGWYHVVQLWLRMALTRPYGFVVKPLYLYGPSGVGKTSAVHRLIGEEAMHSVFHPYVGPFAFEGLVFDLHTIALFDSFDVHDWRDQLKNLQNFISGGRFSFKRKFQRTTQECFSGTSILISTERGELVNSDLAPGLCQVHANMPYFADVRTV